MKIESLKEVFLTKAKDTFLFDCRVANVAPQTMSGFRDVLTSFIRFTGDILVKELTPDHVRMYIDNLSDGPSEGEEHTRTVMSHYAVIDEWVRWLCAQKFIAAAVLYLTHLVPSSLTGRAIKAAAPIAISSGWRTKRRGRVGDRAAQGKDREEDSPCD